MNDGIEFVHGNRLFSLCSLMRLCRSQIIKSRGSRVVNALHGSLCHHLRRKCVAELTRDRRSVKHTFKTILKQIHVSVMCCDTGYYEFSLVVCSSEKYIGVMACISTDVYHKRLSETV